MNIINAAVTDIGIKKNTNQDSLLIKTAMTPIGRVVLAVLCDGMGGLSKGELASATMINAFNEWFTNDFPNLIENGLNDLSLSAQWTALVKKQNEIIKNYGVTNGFNLGTTAVGILITHNRYYCINVGDSRCYELSNSGIRQLTVDQTVIQREYEAGNITLEQMKTDPRRSVLLQCIGSSKDVCPDFYYGTPEYDGEYMLCSDGFRHEISSDEIYEQLNPQLIVDKDTANNALSELVELNKMRGETDNITAIVVRIF